MDISKATNQQLYEIATNEKERMRDRYAAAKELQLRNAKRSIDSFSKIDVQNDGNRWY